MSQLFQINHSPGGVTKQNPDQDGHKSPDTISQIQPNSIVFVCSKGTSRGFIQRWILVIILLRNGVIEGRIPGLGQAGREFPTKTTTVLVIRIHSGIPTKLRGSVSKRLQRKNKSMDAGHAGRRWLHPYRDDECPRLPRPLFDGTSLTEVSTLSLGSTGPRRIKGMRSLDGCIMVRPSPRVWKTALKRVGLVQMMIRWSHRVLYYWSL